MHPASPAATPGHPQSWNPFTTENTPAGYSPDELGSRAAMTEHPFMTVQEAADALRVSRYCVHQRALHRINGSLQLTPVKTNGSKATLPPSAPLVPILREHQRLQGEQRLAAGDGWHDSRLVSTTAFRRPIKPRNVNRMFARLCDRAGTGRQAEDHTQACRSPEPPGRGRRP
ncbi:hypothetical protein [Nocardia sp. CA-290969]|uniref:hypothetical protein n=1 Tax=Nocardia sp. CA-290969 TaxID=3239986 RepID=UPI003D8E4D96